MYDNFSNFRRVMPARENVQLSKLNKTNMLSVERIQSKSSLFKRVRSNSCVQFGAKRIPLIFSLKPLAFDLGQRQMD